MALIEAVPNFSDGRDPQLLASVVEAITVPGVLLLDVSSDPDHNRSVVTIAGAPAAVLDGLFRAVATAAQAIDLFTQRGVHPRLGATDVVPLVPLEDITLDECASLARQLGQRIGSELALPVYLYAAAATRPDRRDLADVRRGQFEGLVDTIHLPERAPDFGPAHIGPAGAVVVGARNFLVAYNFYLDTSDRRVAQNIAREIRQSSGGLPGVKAIGLLVGGRAQVSVNLVDYTQTPLHVLSDTVDRLARVYGTAVAEGELIGLLPQDVVLATAAHYLKLPGLPATRVIEPAIGLTRRAFG